MRTELLCLTLATVAACGTEGKRSGPHVVATVPADGAVDVSLRPQIVVQFDRAMDPVTMSVNLDEFCTGTLQLSADAFSTCVPLTGPPLTDSELLSFTIQPGANLAKNTVYKLRVRDSARAMSSGGSGPALRAPFTMTTGFTTRDAPSVLDTVPIDGHTAIFGSSITIIFDRPMDPATLTANVADDGCTGTMRLSRDDFATCVRMNGPPVPSSQNQMFTATATAPLLPATQYRIAVTDGAADPAGHALDVPLFSTPTGFRTRYRHTIVIDGVNDFIPPSERFVSSSAGYFGFFAWDDEYLYVGIEGPDVASGSSSRFVLLYLDSTAGSLDGSLDGLLYNTQAAFLPFAANWHVRWKADGTFSNAQVWNGAWVDAGWDFTGDVFQSGGYLEFRISRAEIGSPTSARVHLSMINEAAGVEFTYSAVPSVSFVDQYDPMYTRYYGFGFGESDLPTAYLPQP